MSGGSPGSEAERPQSCEVALAVAGALARGDDAARAGMVRAPVGGLLQNRGHGERRHLWCTLRAAPRRQTVRQRLAGRGLRCTVWRGGRRGARLSGRRSARARLRVALASLRNPHLGMALRQAACPIDSQPAGRSPLVASSSSAWPCPSAPSLGALPRPAHPRRGCRRPNRYPAEVPTTRRWTPRPLRRGCGAIGPRRCASRQRSRHLEAACPRDRASRSPRCSRPV